MSCKISYFYSAPSLSSWKLSLCMRKLSNLRCRFHCLVSATLICIYNTYTCTHMYLYVYLLLWVSRNPADCLSLRCCTLDACHFVFCSAMLNSNELWSPLVCMVHLKLAVVAVVIIVAVAVSLLSFHAPLACCQDTLDTETDVGYDY